MKRSILIFRTGQLGDTLVAMPAIDTIYKQHPESKLVLLTDVHSKNKGFISSWDVVKDFKLFNDVIFYKPQMGWLNKILEAISLIIKIRKLKPIKVYNLSHQRSLFQYWRDLFFFKTILGIKNYLAPEIFRHQTRDIKNNLPRLQPEFLRLLNVTGEKASMLNFHLTIPEHGRTEAEKVLKDSGILKTDKYLVLCPGSKMPAKLWPVERYICLSKKLTAEYPSFKIIIVGGQDDLPIANSICNGVGENIFNLCAKLSICGSAAILEKSLAYIGNDTGAMHLAGMVGTPCIAIFSARDYPGRWEPCGNNHKILRHNLNCSPCFLDVCTENDGKCIKMISVDEVSEAVTSLLSKVLTR